MPPSSPRWPARWARSRATLPTPWAASPRRSARAASATLCCWPPMATPPARPTATCTRSPRWPTSTTRPPPPGPSAPRPTMCSPASPHCAARSTAARPTMCRPMSSAWATRWPMPARWRRSTAWPRWAAPTQPSWRATRRHWLMPSAPSVWTSFRALQRPRRCRSTRARGTPAPRSTRGGFPAATGRASCWRFRWVPAASPVPPPTGTRPSGSAPSTGAPAARS